METPNTDSTAQRTSLIYTGLIIILSLLVVAGSYGLGWKVEHQTTTKISQQLTDTQALLTKAQQKPAMVSLANPITINAPETNWKYGKNNSFDFLYPPQYTANVATLGVAEIPGLIYLESSGSCDPSTLKNRVDVNTQTSILHYYGAPDNVGSSFASDPKAPVNSLKEGLICNYDNTESMYFQYYSNKEQDALTVIDSLGMISPVWTRGTSQL